MGVLVCPRCREPFTGVVGSGWLTCLRCQHRWLPSPTQIASAASAESAATNDAPLAVALPSVPLKQAAPVTSAGSAAVTESDEYSPNESGEMKRRTAALTNRQGPAHESDVDPSTVPAAIPIAAGTDPFDPDLFERMAREAQAERQGKSPELPVAPSVGASVQGRVVPSRQIACPVCGHGFPSNRPDDVPQVCPQCQTSFNLAKGHVVSGGSKSAGGDVLLGRVLRGCLIDRKVGEGGMGTVYHARQLSLERSVAIKVLPPELARNRNFITRFEREGKSLAKINHPNILHIYDYGEDQQLGIYFMIIEFVEGRDLGDMLHESYTLGQIEVLDIIRQASMGLEQAAEKGVIHRDIKPDNLMITKEGICKVSDFGLAKGNGAEKDVTSIGVRVGTPAFMSPEQCDGDDVDFRSDIYNLGCTAFLALTGQLPYDADTPFAIMLKHKNDPVPSPRIYNPNLDTRVERLVMRMIAKRPADRFATLRELVQIIEDLEVKLAGTSTVLRKTHGPFRAMSDREAKEHALMTSTGIRRTPAPEDISSSDRSAPIAKSVATPAPIGSTAVPEWLKPVEEQKSHKTTSQLNPMPAPRQVPQTGSVSQQGFKDLRHKLTEARHRNMQDESQTLRAEGDRLAANGQMAMAADAWARAATLTSNTAEAHELLHLAQKARRGRGYGKIFTWLLLIGLLMGGGLVAAFYGVPVGHNLIAEKELEPLHAMVSPPARLTAMESFVSKYGQPLPLYVAVFHQDYPIDAVVRANAEIMRLKIQLAPPPKTVETPTLSKAEQEVKRLESLRDDPKVPWNTVASEARKAMKTGDAKERARPVLEEAQRQLAGMNSDLEEIRKQWTAGHQGQVIVLVAAFRSRYPRAGNLAPAALSGRLVVVDGDSGIPPADVHIVTTAQAIAGEERDILNSESTLAHGELIFCRYPQRAVTLVITAPGYRPETKLILADPNLAEIKYEVRLRPGEAWRAQVGEKPAWLRLHALANSPFALVSTPQHQALVRLSTGELRSPIVRSQSVIPVGSEGAFWTDCLNSRGGGYVIGTTDGLALELLIGADSISLGALLHRSTTPVLAFADKELTFQAKRATYVVTAVAQKMSLSARTNDKDLWSRNDLSGFQRPIMWFQDDRVLVMDDRQLMALDEADGHPIATHSFVGVRSGAPLQIPNSQIWVIPTTEGAVATRIPVTGESKISQVDDKALYESRARLMTQDGVAFLTAAQDKSLRLLTWTGAGFNRTWSAQMPANAGQPKWLTLTPDRALIGDDQGNVYLLSRADGTLQRHIIHPVPLWCPPIISDGRLIIGDRDGNLTGYHLPPIPGR
jgi:serine/threonine protein kinase